MLIQPVELNPPDKDTFGQILEEIFATIDEERLDESEIVNIMNTLCFLKYYQRKETGKDKKCGEIIYRMLR